MLKNKLWIGIILSIILLVFGVNGLTAYYKYTQESGANFYVGTADKSDALEDTNEMRQILDDLGNLLGHSLRNDLYPEDGNTGGYLSVIPTNIVYCSYYDHPDDAITAIGASNKTLLVTEAETCDINFTVPANVTVRFERGGKWTINNGITVTFNGQIDAGLWQIFAYTGTGVINFGVGIGRAYPQWWGIDGTADQVEIQAAIASLAACGGEVYLVEGDYNLTEAIDLDQDCVSLIGASVGSVPVTTAYGTTIFQVNDTQNAIVIAAYQVQVRNLYIRGSPLGGAKIGEIGIHITSGQDCKIDNVNISYFNTYGISFDGVNNMWLTNSRLNGNTTNLYVSSSHDITIADNQFETPVTYCVYFHNCYSIVITGNIIEDGAVRTLFCSNLNTSTITGNMFNGAASSDIVVYFLSSNKNTISGNEIEANASEGVRFEGCADNVFSNNVISGVPAGEEDIYVRNTNTGNTISNNRCSSANADYSIYIQYNGNTGNSIYGNHCSSTILDSSGNNNLVFPGGQIAFPVTQIPSANANTLDDYEEGEWTPVIAFGGASVGMTYSIQAGLYTKIGRQVTCTGRVVLTAKGTSTGDAQITGLPFTCKDDNGAYSAVLLKTGVISFADIPQAIVLKNTVNIDLQECTIAGVVTKLNDTNFANTSNIIFSIIYFTD